MKYYNLTSSILKTPTNFNDNSEAKIKINKFVGEPINLKSGFAQESIVSPNFFLIYTKDISPLGPGCMDIIFADDISQIVSHESKNKNIMAQRAIMEIERINNYDYKWNIKTNTNKFQLLSFSKSKPCKIYINNKINYSDKIKTFELTLGRCGIN